MPDSTASSLRALHTSTTAWAQSQSVPPLGNHLRVTRHLPCTPLFAAQNKEKKEAGTRKEDLAKSQTVLHENDGLLLDCAAHNSDQCAVSGARLDLEILDMKAKLKFYCNDKMSHSTVLQFSFIVFIPGSFRHFYLTTLSMASLPVP